MGEGVLRFLAATLTLTVTPAWHGSVAAANPLPPQRAAAERDQLRALSAQWAPAKRLPEMGFTLGGLDEMDDPQVRLLLAVDTDERVQAVTSWLPVRARGATVGWTLDLMRRRPDAPLGIMEFLIATAALDLRADGATLLSLSGAPLARHTTGTPIDVHGLQRLLDMLARRLEPVYGFGSLLAFKTKFQPLYRPLYLAYRARSHFPPSATRWPAPTYPNSPRGRSPDSRAPCWG